VLLQPSFLKCKILSTGPPIRKRILFHGFVREKEKILPSLGTLNFLISTVKQTQPISKQNKTCKGFLEQNGATNTLISRRK
jgi:hypothetical protein